MSNIGAIQLNSCLYKIWVKGVSFFLFDYPGSHTPEILAVDFQKHVPDFSNMKIDTVLDIGANTGFFTFYIKKLFPSARVVAVEPLELNVENLKRGVLLNDMKGVTIIERAVTIGQSSEIYLDPNNSGSTSFFNSKTFPMFHVEQIDLNDIVQMNGIVGLMKMDIEGSEFDVLRNFKKWHLVNSLFIEFHPFPYVTLPKHQEELIEEMVALLAEKMKGKPVWSRGLEVSLPPEQQFALDEVRAKAIQPAR